MSEETDVVIIGGGPIGLTLSYILGQNDINHVLLEQNATTSKWPKASIVNTRSMELYRRLGLDTVLREKSLSGGQQMSVTSCLHQPPVAAIPITQFVGINPQKQPDGTNTFDEKWTSETVCWLSQIFMEPIIKAEASKFKTSDIKFGWKAQALSQTDDNVQVEAVDVKTGETKLYQARYVVGCDGGKSLVRKSLGIHFKGRFDLMRFQTVSFRSPEFKKRLLSDDIISFMSKRNYLGLIVRLDEEGDFVVHFVSQKKVEPDEIVKRTMESDDIPYTLLFENEWNGHFAFAEELQSGRVFLAGDSCHVVIPVGGFGMNTGVLDAYDIGWKLVATIKGWGGERLLASYTVERSHGIKKLVERIEQLYYAVTTYLPLITFLVSTRPFKYIVRWFIDAMNPPAGLSGILFGIRLERSPLCIPSGPPVPPADPLNYTPLAQAGCRTPYFEFEDGTTLYDKLGSAFTLVHLQPSSQNFDPILAAAAHCGIPLKVVSFNDQKLKKLYRGMDLVIIRPDLYIAWCGSELPTLLHTDDVNTSARMLMKVITGAQPLPPEWRQTQYKESKSTFWCLPVMTSLIIGISATSFVLLRHLNYIK